MRELYVWGSNSNGQLCLPSATNGKCIPDPQPVSINLDISEIACGESHIAILTCTFNDICLIATGTVYTVGGNTYEKSATTPQSPKSVFKPQLVVPLSNIQIVQLSCGWSHTVAVDCNGFAYSWGYGKTSALGHGETQATGVPTKISHFEKIGVRIKTSACGAYHTAFISTEQNLFTCGSNHSGQLGIGSRDHKSTPTLVKTIGKVMQVACGVVHTLIIVESGDVYATGGNTFGQLGTGTKLSSDIPKKVLEVRNAKAVSCGHHSAAVTEEGKLYIWGTGTFGEVLIPKVFLNGISVEEVKLGACFGAIRDVDDNTWIWGTNTSGELGTGDFEPKPEPHLLKKLKRIEKIACGSAFVITLIKPESLSSPDSDIKNITILSSPKTKRIGTILHGNHLSRANPFGYILLSNESNPLSPSKRVSRPDSMRLSKRLSLEDTAKRDELKVYKKELEEVKQEVAQLKSSVIQDLSKEDNDRLIGENAELKKRVKELEGKWRDGKVELKNAIQEMNNMRGNYHKEKEELIQIVNNECEEKKKILGEFTDINQENCKLKSQVEELREIINESNMKHKETVNKIVKEKQETEEQLQAYKNEAKLLQINLSELTKKLEAEKAFVEEYKTTIDNLKKGNNVQAGKIEDLLKEKLRLSADLERVLIENSTFLGLLEQYESVKTTIKMNKEVQTIGLMANEVTFVAPMRVLKKVDLEKVTEGIERRGMSASVYTPANRGKSKDSLKYLQFGFEFDNREGSTIRYQKNRLLDEKLSFAMQKYKGTKQLIGGKSPMNPGAKRYRFEEEKVTERTKRSSSELIEHVQSTKNKIFELRKSQEDLQGKLKDLSKKI